MPEADATPSLQSDLTLLRDVSREAGRIAMRYFGKNPKVWIKGASSPVTEADHAVNDFLHEALLAARPDYGWLSEETVDDEARLSASRTFVVDPIDGTRGFIDGSRKWCVSVAVVENGRSLTGVLECPASDETYWAASGQGAFKNDVHIHRRVAGDRLEIAGLKVMIDELPADLLPRIDRRTHIPSLACRIAMIAAGALDATFIKPNAHDWDIAAADLILREAGGLILTATGAPPVLATATPAHGPMAAGSGELLAQMVESITRREAANAGGR